MNYGSAATLGKAAGGSMLDALAMPIGLSWRRVNWGLSGYGNLLPATLSTPEPVAVEHSTSPACLITWSLEVE